MTTSVRYDYLLSLTQYETQQLQGRDTGKYERPN